MSISKYLLFLAVVILLLGMTATAVTTNGGDDDGGTCHTDQSCIVWFNQWEYIIVHCEARGDCPCKSGCTYTGAWCVCGMAPPQIPSQT